MSKIVDKEMWDHYSELPNPAWYDYKNKQKDELEYYRAFNKLKKQLKYDRIKTRPF